MHGCTIQASLLPLSFCLETLCLSVLIKTLRGRLGPVKHLRGVLAHSQQATFFLDQKWLPKMSVASCVLDCMQHHHTALERVAEMSQETLDWLNQYTLIGFTSRRGQAWHYRAGADNHFPDAVPLDVVESRLFDWSVEESNVLFETTDGTKQYPGKKIYYRSDNRLPIGLLGKGHQGHSYREWLLNKVANILDDSLSIGSAGLLRGGAQAWVSVEVSENVTTPEGVTFRPNLLAVTSFDGTLKTTYKRVVTNVVCDNTMAMALAEKYKKYSVKHTKNSQFDVLKAREAVDVIFSIEDAFSQQIATLCAQKVSNKQWDAFLDIAVAVPEVKEGPRGSAGATRAQNKRDLLDALWTGDERVTPWKGTAWGVLQAVNTFTHHFSTVKKVSHLERNMERAMRSGVQSIEEHDRQVLNDLERALA